MNAYHLPRDVGVVLQGEVLLCQSNTAVNNKQQTLNDYQQRQCLSVIVRLAIVSHYGKQ